VFAQPWQGCAKDSAVGAKNEKSQFGEVVGRRLDPNSIRIPTIIATFPFFMDATRHHTVQRFSKYLRFIG